MVNPQSQYLHDIVEGTVIDCGFSQYFFHRPDGSQHGDPRYFTNEIEAATTFKAFVAGLKSSLGPEFDRLGWNGRWELRRA